MDKLITEMGKIWGQPVSTVQQKPVGERPQLVHTRRDVFVRTSTSTVQPSIYPRLLPHASTVFTTRKNQHPSLLTTQLYPPSTVPITTITIFI